MHLRATQQVDVDSDDCIALDPTPNSSARAIATDVLQEIAAAVEEGGRDGAAATEGEAAVSDREAAGTAAAGGGRAATGVRAAAGKGPHAYLHLGGDEVKTACWDAVPHIQVRVWWSKTETETEIDR